MKILDVPQSGSQAGTTASRNRFGQYRRTKAAPTNPNTAKQRAARSLLGMVSSAWKSLTDGVRAQWGEWALAHPRTDSLGQTVILTGAQAFTSVACKAIAMGLSLPSAPPVLPVSPPPEGWIASTITFTPSALAVAVADAGEGTSNDWAIYGYPPTSPGVSFDKGRRFLKSATSAQLDNEAGVTVTTEYAAAFGLPQEGQRVAIEIEYAPSGQLLASNKVAGIISAV